ncbi:TonB-dependent siderophore receptor [Hydrocarboniclastica marina]|uniref:TonB-dependent siderophore receptor n=1 Tax=Hydrocarboniclastica marina TaxID=2259620 RepID=A0A4V1D8J2_9ALTE|nr:TonB-dependent siderophore receptor [Hydrocarboniclastica marina]QCF25380.1 TonB-dependent siderophore receptor [Hydrocarboniclastica marina]
MTQGKRRAGSAQAHRLHANSTTLLCCASLMASPLSAYAQDPSGENKPDEVFRLSPIIVNAQAYADDDANSVVAQELWVGGKVATSILDTPASVSVITEKEIEQRNATTTEEILQYTPGVVTDYYGTDDRNDYFQIRGFQATTYRDGLTLGSMRGVREEPYAFERVEVLRGANSTLFGPADPGGSVNFVSKRPRFESFGEGYLTYGSFDHKEAGVDVGDALEASETVAYRFTGKIKDSEREYDHSEDDDQFVMGGLTWEPTAYTSATLILDYLNQDSTPNSGGYPFDREYDRSEFFGEPEYNFHDVERTSATTQLTHDFANGLVLRGNLRYSDLTDDLGYVYITDSSDRTGTLVDRGYIGTDSGAEELIGNAMLQYDASFERFDSSTLVGIEYRDATSESTSVYAPGAPIDVADPVYSGAPVNLVPYRGEEQDYKTKSVFLQQNLSFVERLIVTVGVRNDNLDLSSKNLLDSTRSSDDFSETSIRGAVTYRVTDEISTYVSRVESVAPPSIGTEPERGEQYEVGIKYSPLGMNALFSAAVYDLTKKDISIRVAQDDGTIEDETIGEARVRGLDLEAKAELIENLSLTAGYSYMDTEVRRADPLRDGTTIEGNEFNVAPRHTSSLWSYYTLSQMNMSFGLGARYTGAYYFDAANTAESDSATLFDAAFSYRIAKGTDVEVNVSNLLDEQHVVGSGTADYYNPGREITATLSYNW